jgi:DNA-directed RNA polymerase sigma subunit (sigma70/sigma32)
LLKEKHHRETKHIPVPVVSAAAQRELIRRWQQEQDIAARDQLVRMTMALVTKMIGERDWMLTDYDDAYQNASIELLTAIDRFDLSQPWNFVTYARHWILKSFYDTAATRDSEPSHVAARRNAIRRIEKEALAAGQTEERAAQTAYAAKTQHEKYRLNKKVPLADVAEIELSISQPAPSIDVAAMMSAITNKRHDTILRFNLGLLGNRPWKMAYIGRVMGLSRERIRQLREIGLEEIRRSVSR